MANINKILSLAKERGVSNTFICSKLGLGRGYLNDVKNGKATISDERLKIIAELLNTTPEYLKDETDEIEKTPSSEMDEGVVIFHRNGKTVTEHFTEEQMRYFEKMVEAIKNTDNDRL